MRRFLNNLICAFAIAAASLPATAQNAAFDQIEQLEFRESSVGDAIRLLSRLTGVNIFATREAADREFSMSVNDSTVKGVVASIARVTGLSYSYDAEAKAFIILTNEQFANDVVITRNSQTKVFNLRHQNVVSAARVVESLFGDRVELTLDTDDPDRLEISDGALQSSRSVGSSNNGRVRLAGGGNQGNRGDDDDVSNVPTRALQELARAQDNVVSVSEIASRAGLEPTIYITINREHNLLYVRTSDRQAMRDIEGIIKQTDRPTKQVLLEVRVMALDLDDEFRSAFNFGLSGNFNRTFTGADGETTSTGPNIVTSRGGALSNNGLFFQTIDKNLLSQINLLERDNRAHTISTPLLSTSNNTPARLFVGSEAVLARGFSSQTTVGTTGQSITNTQTDTELREVGQTLEILPRINADDTVTLVVQQENSTIVPGGATVPVVGNGATIREVQIDTINTARVGGTVTARSGRTIAIGGLISDSRSKASNRTPVLGNIPLLGLAFRGDSRRDERSELILLITPHIYSGGPEGERKARERLARISRNQDIDAQGFSASDNGVPSVALKGQRQHFVSMTRFAASMRHGTQPQSRGPFRGIDSVELSSGTGLGLVSHPGVTAEAVESWRRQNLYVTAVALTNTQSKQISLNVKHLQGRWLAATLEQNTLKPRGEVGSRGYLYLISDRPFDAVVADLNAGGGL